VQDAAVQDASDKGWPPERFRAAGTGFVVREMRAIHHREASYGEALTLRTQVADHRRDVMMRRETQVDGVMDATADWVHIGREGSPQRATPELIAAFPASATAPVLAPLPEPPAGPAGLAPGMGTGGGTPLPAFIFSPWWTEMDPLGHTNHPRYVDWADEALSRALHAAGIDPTGLVPIAERVRFRAGARAVDTITVSGHRLGAVVVQTAAGPRPGVAFQFRARRVDLASTASVSGRSGGSGALVAGDVVADMYIVRAHLRCEL
jgi:acyl-CoA thioesterase FadM